MSSRHTLQAVAALMILFVFMTATFARNIVYRSAVGLWEDAVSKSPDKARSHYNLGRLYSDQRRSIEALREYQAAVRLDPADPVTHYNIGNMLLVLGRAADAVPEYRAALALRPGYPDALHNLEAALRLMIDNATTSKDRQAEAAGRNNLGNLFFMQRKFAESRKEYEAALRLAPGFAEAHYNLGKVLTALNAPGRAEAEFLTAIRLQPDDPDAHFILGSVYESTGRPAKARSEYETALQLRSGIIKAQKDIRSRGK